MGGAVRRRKAPTASERAGATAPLGELGEAEMSYRRAIDVDPDYAAAHNDLGKLLQQQGRLDEAAAAFARFEELEGRKTE